MKLLHMKFRAFVFADLFVITIYLYTYFVIISSTRLLKISIFRKNIFPNEI